MQSEQLACLDPGPSAVMNCTARPGGKVLACGMDEHCALIGVSTSTLTDGSPAKGARERRGKKSSKSPDTSASLSILSKKQTDFHDKYALHKVARFNQDGNVLVTGGADGRVRVWQVIIVCVGVYLLLFYFYFLFCSTFCSLSSGLDTCSTVRPCVRMTRKGLCPSSRLSPAMVIPMLLEIHFVTHTCLQ